MKHLRKITMIVIIFLLLSFFTLICINNIYAEVEQLSVIDGGGKSVKLTPKTNIWLVQSGNSLTYKDVDNITRHNILNQAYVWCAEPGINLSDGVYKTEGPYKSNDTVLNYIINQGPISEKSDYCTTAQVALWYYLTDNNRDSADKDIILDRIDKGALKNPNETVYNEKTGKYEPAMKELIGKNKDFFDLATKIYEDACNYSNHSHSGSISISDLTNDGSTIKFKVNGYNTGDTLNVKIDEAVVTPSNVDSNGSVTITGCTGDKVEVILSHNQINAEYMILKNANNQRMIVAKAKTITTTYSASMNLYTDISLQKYIVAVNGYEFDSEGSRKNKYDNKTNKNNISCIESISDTDTDFYKEENPISIEAGDTVTYRIYVYNNSSVTAKEIYVRDQLPAKVKIGDIKYDKGYQFDTKIENLNGNDSTYFDVTMEFIEHDTSEKLRNKAWIYSTSPTNKMEYRQEDADYVKMKKYSVSLEKYVTQVSDKDGNNVINVTDRDGHPTYNPDNTKVTNPVKLEVGDIVTYTIKLTNTNASGHNTKIKVTQIKDTPHNNDGVKLKYKEISGDGSPIYNSDNTITFNSPSEISPGSTVKLTVKFEVDVPLDKTNAVQTLQNTAKVTEIQNRNDVTVGDSDGDTNNKDSDWVETKLYSVSLEKYVSAVNGTEVPTSREGKAQHKYDDDNSTNNDWKYKNVVTVSNGDTVTYTIKVKNDGKDTKAIITNIADYFPNGVEYSEIEYTENVYCTAFNNGQTKNTVSFSNEIELKPEESKSFTVQVKVIEPNISVRVMENVAEITNLKNKNDKEVKDKTQNDNKDADYIQVSHTEEEKKTEYTVKKVWETNGYEKPAQVTVKLLKVKGSEEIDLGMESVVLSDANAWEYKWTDLPILESDWKYVVRELNEAGTDLLPGGGRYNGNIKVEYVDETSSKLTTITNTIEDVPPPPSQDKTSYTVEKVWQDEDNKDGVRPNSVKVRLFKKQDNKLEQVKKDNNGNEISDVILGSGNWTYTWNNLPKYENDKLVEYIAKEFNQDGKKVLYGENETNGDNFGSGYTVSYIHETDKTTIYNTNPPTEITSDDFTISGMVWNDMALNKLGNKYNGLKDDEESNLSGIEVILYRDRKGIVATTTTNENGEYRFTNADLYKSLPENERYIKGPKVAGTNRWAGTYYDYYVRFKYDGVTYTSTDNYTKWTTVDKNDIDSNAKENQGIVEKYRESFNEQFEEVYGNTVKGSTGNHIINYSTVNEEGYIPQSIYKYDPSWMAIESCTELINLSNYKDKTISDLEKLQIQLNHINLGLKGRDIFDLELTSDVYSTKVTVNGVDGTYNYNSNKITVRRNDCNNYNYVENSANIFYEDNYYKGENYEQRVRSSDITNDRYTNGETGLAIEVTYKITVKNASKTAGTATKVTNYYDDGYTFIKAYSDSGYLGTTDGDTGTGYKSVVITTPSKPLDQSKTMDIYVVYKLIDPVKDLKDLNTDDKLVTYNMAEITAYKTIGTGNEATRGLLDKDSAPGSVVTENVRLHPNTIKEGTSTVDYYFGGSDLSKLKYEDDTYVAPTLYFVKDMSERIITGTVFEDLTETDSTTRIKTGNGKLDIGEVGVFGATVQLIENSTVILETSTIANGIFEFHGFLPGTYQIKYFYGDKENTVLLNQNSNGINSKSYNGEDFQATNNAYIIEGMKTNKLDTTLNYWYVINEKEENRISTATDDSTRRFKVRDNVLKFTDELMTVLNNMRDGKTKDECNTEYNNAMDSTTADVDAVKQVIDNTYMYACTNSLLITVEETIKLSDYNTDEIKGKYNKIDDTFATWAIFPNENDEHYKEYKIEHMNFGIAEVPVTTVDLNKSLNRFTITDSVGQNVIASYENGKTKGFVTGAKDTNEKNYWVQIEDEKLQGARLEITYDITINMQTEKNFDNTSNTVPTITEIVDFIDNSLSYNEKLGNNSQNWEVTNYDDTQEQLKKMEYKIDGITTTIPQGTIDPNGDKYTTIVKATTSNPLLLKDTGEATATITLEKVLSSTNSTIEEIITSTVESYEYSNIVEIIGFDYTNNTTSGTGGGTSGGEDDDEIMRDRVRTSKRYIILPGVQHDSATSETLVITPPTGDSSISITYYIIAVISLAVLAVGVFGIKKFVIKK